MLSKETLGYGDKITAITLGIDRLYREEERLAGRETDGLAVLNMGFDKVWDVDDYAEAREVLRELSKEAYSLPEDDRRMYYAQACMSLDSFCVSRMGMMADIRPQVSMFLHVNPAPTSEAELNGYYARLRSALNSMGYDGDLKAQLSEWEARNRVPAENVKEVMSELMDVARERTGAILELPENDYYRCETESGSAFNAKSDYDNRTVWINTDPVLTLPGLKHLVCHECYPGHFMQFTLRRVLYERGLAASDGLLSVVNHSSSSTFEGIADAGIEFIDWVENDDDRVYQILGDMRSALGTMSSYQMHVLKWPEAEVEKWLADHALIGGEGWVKGRLRFIRDTARSALIWSYWRGDQGVFDIWHNVSVEDRVRFFEYIYGRLHTVQSMQMFR